MKNVINQFDSKTFKITVEEVTSEKFIATLWDKRKEVEEDRCVSEFETFGGAMSKAFKMLSQIAKVVIPIFAFTILSGCATTQDFLMPHYTTFCYINEKNQDVAAREKDYNQCGMQVVTKQQHASCMYLRGYELAVCDAKTGEFVRR